jgi:hypothetical protein
MWTARKPATEKNTNTTIHHFPFIINALRAVTSDNNNKLLVASTFG